MPPLAKKQVLAINKEGGKKKTRGNWAAEVAQETGGISSRIGPTEDRILGQMLCFLLHRDKFAVQPGQAVLIEDLPAL